MEVTEKTIKKGPKSIAKGQNPCYSEVALSVDLEERNTSFMEKIYKKSAAWDLPALEENSFFIPPEDTFYSSSHEYESGSQYLEYHWNKDGTYSTEWKDWKRK